MKHLSALLLFLSAMTLLAIAFATTAQAQALRYFEFDFRTPYPDSLNLYAATNDPAVLAEVDAQLALPDTLRYKHINGPIAHGTADNNPRFSWHFVQSAWALADFSIELCDGRPLEDVEADTAYWIGNVGQFCPWASYVKREIFPLSSPAPHVGGGEVRMANIDAATGLVQNGYLQSQVRLTGILDLQGRAVRALDIALAPGATTRLDLEGLAAGAYLLRYEANGLGVGTLRFMRF